MTLVYALAMGALAAGALAAALRARVGAVFVAVGSLLLLAVGLVACAGGPHPTLDLGSWLGFGAARLDCDGLAGIFLGLTGVTAAAVSLRFFERPMSRLVTALHAIVVLATATVIGANQAFLLLLAWELLTVCLYLLASVDRDRPGTLLAGYFTGGVTKVGGGALLASFALLYGQTGSFDLAAWAHAAISPGARGVAFVLLLLGFGTKLGVIPIQGAVPVGYQAAPGASPATISVALSAGFYGLWRLLFDILGPGPLWWGEALLIVASVTAFAGVLYAIAQDEVRRFLGFSTIEHTGIALMGLGVALVGQAAHQPKLAAAGLLAGTLHLVAHGLGKTLAFLADDRLERATGTREMAPLGGLARRLPRTASGFGLAVLTLAAVPPLAGFVSEWMTFEALLQAFRLEGSFTRLVMALAAALLALTAGLGLLAFAKLYGFIFLGQARRALSAVREPRDLGLGVALLSVIVLALGPAAPWEIHLIGSGLRSSLGFNLATTAISHPLVLGPVYAKFSVLAPTWLAIVLPAYALIAALLVRGFMRPRGRRAPVWVTGSAAPIDIVQYRPAAYSNPMRVVMAGPYRYRRSTRRAHDSRSELASTLVVETRVVLAVEQYLYQPLARLVLWASDGVRRLQSGRLSAYLLYMLVVILVVLALIPALQR